MNPTKCYRFASICGNYQLELPILRAKLKFMDLAKGHISQICLLTLNACKHTQTHPHTQTSTPQEICQTFCRKTNKFVFEHNLYAEI